MFVVYDLIFISIFILFVIARYRLFKKIGLNPMISLIPVIGTLRLFNTVKYGKLNFIFKIIILITSMLYLMFFICFLISLFVVFLAGIVCSFNIIINVFGTNKELFSKFFVFVDYIKSFVSILISIIKVAFPLSIICWICFGYKFARKFNKSEEYSGVLSILLIFEIIILGFDKSKYKR